MGRRREVLDGVNYIRVYIGDKNQFLKNRERVLKLIKRKDKPQQKMNLGEFARTKMQMSN